MPKAKHKKVEKYIPVPESGCWIWLGVVFGSGHGRVVINENGVNRETGAHRLSWEVHKGAIPEGKHVLHTCDVPCCINPAHLYIGTHQDNMRDKAHRGRVNITDKMRKAVSESNKRRMQAQDPKTGQFVKAGGY